MAEMASRMVMDELLCVKSAERHFFSVISFIPVGLLIINYFVELQPAEFLFVEFVDEDSDAL